MPDSMPVWAWILVTALGSSGLWRSSPGGPSVNNAFTPGQFIGVIAVEPNVDYSINMSFQTWHQNTGSQNIIAYGHCKYRRLFIMPV